jgi:flagellin-like protein
MFVLSIVILRKEKAISPVISVIILIVVALVIALTTGIFTFGVFTSQTKSLSVQSAILETTDAAFIVAVTNPSATDVAVNSVNLLGPGIISGSGVVCSSPGTARDGTTTLLVCSTSGSVTHCHGHSPHCHNKKWTTPIAQLNPRNDFEFTVDLGNGQAISDVVISQ